MQLNYLAKILTIIFVSVTVIYFVFMLCSIYSDSVDMDLSLGRGSIARANVTI